MKHSKLSEHIFKKGKFISPMNNAFGDQLKTMSWSNERLPEYLWLACILEAYPRTIGIEKAYLILKKISEVAPNIELPLFSEILNLPKESQIEIFNYIKSILDKNVFYPLSLLFTYSEYPVFSYYFCNPNIGLKKREEKLIYLLNIGTPHQSNFATDIRFLIISFLIIRNKLIFNSEMKETVERLPQYPYISHDDEQMKAIRPFIRATEGTLQGLIKENQNNKFIQKFWERMSLMSDCQLNYMNWKQEDANTEDYVCILKNIFKYLAKFFSTEKPLDDKASVLIGIATYSYKRLSELSEFKLSNTITARGTIRVLLENYIMIKYLVKNDSSDKSIWLSFKEYGIGCYKSVIARIRDNQKDFPSSHIEPKYLEGLVNSLKNEEFIDVDTSYFDKQNIREKAISVDEKELWGRFYDYGSSYEHGLWGSILESSMLMCNNPSHQFHFVPDFDNSQTLKSVWPDAVMLMNKTINFINTIYEIPAEFLEAMNEYETKLS